MVCLPAWTPGQPPLGTGLARGGARLLTLDQASALAFSWSNSVGVIDPLSSSAFAEEI